MTISLKEALEWTEQSLDRQVARALDQSELVLLDRGATEAELACFQAEYKAELEAWKTASLAEIMRGLKDWSAPSGKLQ